jgi:hypothetical protein
MRYLSSSQLDQSAQSGQTQHSSLTLLTLLSASNPSKPANMTPFSSSLYCFSLWENKSFFVFAWNWINTFSSLLPYQHTRLSIKPAHHSCLHLLPILRIAHPSHTSSSSLLPITPHPSHTSSSSLLPITLHPSHHCPSHLILATIAHHTSS